jgi:DnaK suppressor protein
MAAMTKSELKTFQSVLEARQMELENGIGDREALAIDTSPDELDRIQHATVRELAIGNLERESSRLRDVQAALRRIDAGMFGICLDCEEDINLKRLSAVPWTRFCIACQEAAEHQCKAFWSTFEPSLLSTA